MIEAMGLRPTPNKIKFEAEEDMTYAKSRSSKLSTVECSFYDLQCMFGKPAFEGKGDNITTEFLVNYEAYISDEMGVEEIMGQFRLYDWYYSRDFNDDYKDITWNIGGNSFEDEEHFRIALKLFQDTDIRYGSSYPEPCIATEEYIEINNYEEAA